MIQDQDKTKTQLIDELEQTRNHVAELERTEDVLRESEERSREVFEHSLDALYKRNLATGKYEYVSPAIAKITGYTPEEVIAMSPEHIEALIHPEDIERINDLRRNLLETTKAHDTVSQAEYRVKCKDGSYRWISDHFTLLGDVDGRPLYSIASVRDITERKRAERKIQQYTEDITLINNLNTAINEGASLDDVFALLSKETKRLFRSYGVTTYLISDDKQSLVMKYMPLGRKTIQRIEQLAGIKIPDLTIPKSADNIYWKAIESGQGALLVGDRSIQLQITDFVNEASFPNKLVRASAKKIIPEIQRFLSLKSTIIIPLISKDRVVGLIDLSSKDELALSDLERLELIAKQLSNILARKQAEEALREEKELSEAILDTALDTIFVFDPVTGRPVRWNRAFREISGYSDEEIRAKKAPADWYRDVDLEKTKVENEKLLRGEKSVIKISLITKNGELIPTEYTASMTYDAEDNPEYILAVGRDITERKLAEGELRQSEEKYRQLFATVSDAIVMFDAKTKQFLDVNVKAIELYDHTREEFLQMRQPDISAEPKASELSISETLAGNRELVPLRYHKKKDDTVFPVEISSAVFNLSDQQVVCCVIRDISERRRMEKALRESEEKYRTLFEQSPVGISTLDLSGIITSCNPAVFQEGGYSEKDLIGKHFIKITPLRAKDIPKYVRVFNSIIRGKDPKPFEVTYQRKDGTTGHSEIHTALLKIGDKKIGVQVLQYDITERKRAEEALRESEERYRELADSITDVFFAFDKDLKYTYWNKASEELTGIPAKDAIGKSLYELFPDTPQTRRAEKVYLDVLKKQQPQTFINKYSIESKEYFFEISAYPSGDGLSVFTKDITERKQAEEEIKQRSEELAALNSVATVVSQSLNLDEILNTGLDKVLELMHLDVGGIYLADSVGHKLDLAVHRGISKEFAHEIGTVSVDEKTLETVVAEGKLRKFILSVEAVIKDRAELQRILSAMKEEDLRLDSAVPVLLHAKEEILGVITVASRGPRQFSEKDLQLLTSFGQQIAIAIKNAQLYKAAQQEISDRKQAEEALHENEERYRRLSEATFEGIVVHDQGRIVDTNTSFANMFGYEPSELIGMNALEFAAPELRNLAESQIRTGSEEPYEGIALRKDGTEFTVEVSGKNISVSGRPMRVIAVRDITKRKQSEEALRQSDIRFRSLVEHTSEAIFCYEYDPPILTGLPIEEQVQEFYRGILVECNDVAAGTYGAEAANEVLGKGLTELFGTTPGSLDEFFKTFIKDGYTQVDAEETENLPDGTKRYYLNNSHGVIDNGNLIHIWGTYRDITDRKQAGEALRESEGKYRAIFEQAADSIVLVDGETGELIEFNDRTHENLGYTREEFEKLKIPDFEVIESIEEVAKHIEKIIKEGFDTFETKHRTKDGEIRDILVNSRSISIHGKDFVLSVWRDITERKQTADELRESREQLRSLSAHLQSIREESQKLLAREIHDELGQALTVLKLDLTDLKSSLQDDGRISLEKVNTMSELVESLIKVVKSISSRLRPALLDDLGIAAALEWEAGEFKKRTGINCELEIEPLDIILEPEISTTVYRIFQEVLTNVARHAEATTVEASLQIDSDKLELEINDNGIGITGKQISSSESFGLIGLRERALEWGGIVNIEGKKGEGTTVAVTIPLESRGNQDD